MNDFVSEIPETNQAGIRPRHKTLKTGSGHRSREDSEYITGIHVLYSEFTCKRYYSENHPVGDSLNKYITKKKNI